MPSETSQTPSASRGGLHFIIAAGLLITFCALTSISFSGLLSPPQDPNTKTLAAVSNGYDSQIPLAAICDRDGKTLIGNVVLDADGKPMRNADGTYLLLTDLPPEEQKTAIYTRLILTKGSNACWSNVLPGWSGGADSSFGDYLQMLSIDGEMTSLRLTLDSSLQQAAFNALSDRERASAFVMDLNSGDVLAMVSKPSYDFNSFRTGDLPYTRFTCHISQSEGAKAVSYFNTDNSHDCAEDYYKQWKTALRRDNNYAEFTVEPDENGVPVLNGGSLRFNGAEMGRMKAELLSNGLLLNRQQAEEIIRNWEKAGYAVDTFDLDSCGEYVFESLLKSEAADTKGFQFAEPEGLGSGTRFVPFIKVKFNVNDTQYSYLRLTYGSNNFILADCKKTGFDPNFSYTNFNTVNAAPGSCFKMLMASLLADSADAYRQGSGAQTEIMLGHNYQDKWNPPLPAMETYKHSTDKLRDALVHSSNQYFSMCAMQLDRIVNRPEKDITRLISDDLTAKKAEDALRSGQILDQFYREKFCINQPIDSDFRIQAPSMFSHFDSVDIHPKDEADATDDYVVFRDQDGYYFTGLTDYLKKLGDTSYGMGDDLVTPIYMSMAIGKCLTGNMVIPNFLSEASGEIRTCGEPFSHDDTPEIMRSHLASVSDHYFQTNKAEKPTLPALNFYAKTGTSSVEKRVGGTQGRYGLFAEKQFGNYAVVTSTDPNGRSYRKYETIWYVGAVSDNAGHAYAIVIRSFFDTAKSGSGGLNTEFCRIADALCKSSKHYLTLP